MVYNVRIPRPTDKIKNSQSDIATNFADIKTLIDVDHETFDSVDEGKHKRLNCPRLAASPNNVFFSDKDMALFAKLSKFPATSGQTELFLRKAGVAGDKIEFTVRQSLHISHKGWTQLPSGIIIKWNKVAIPSISITNDPIVASISHGKPFTNIGTVLCMEYYDGDREPGFVVNVDSFTTVLVTLNATRAIRDFAGPTKPGSALIFVIGD